ncbi:MAG: hypothetical protein ABL982_23730, partial [Vicinamibacterales bacterium]
IERLTDAVERLATSHDELSRRVDALQEQSDLGLVDLVERVSAMRSRVRDLSTRSVRLVRSAQATRAAVRLERRRRQIIAMEGQLDRLASIVQSAQSAAYSQKGSVLAPNNVRLAANALVWGLLGPALRAFGVVASTELNPAAIVAPLGSFVSGQLLLSGRAPVRFISDITRFDPADNSISLSLRNYLGDAQWRALVAREDVPVVVTELDPIGLGNLRAVVRSGVLTITAPIGLIAFMAGGGAPEPPRVAWVVDLGAAHG